MPNLCEPSVPETSARWRRSVWLRACRKAGHSPRCKRLYIIACHSC